MFPWPRVGAPFGGCLLILTILFCLITGILFLVFSTRGRRKGALRILGILLLLAPVGMIAMLSAADRQVEAMYAHVDSALVPGQWVYESTRLTLDAGGTYHLDGTLAAFDLRTQPRPDGHWRLPNGGNILTLEASNDAAPVELFVFWYGDQVALFPFSSEAYLDPDAMPPARFLLKAAKAR